MCVWPGLRRVGWTTALLGGLLSSGCGTTPHPGVVEGEEVAIAAAANLTQVAGVLGQKFEAESGIHAVFSFASTAQLAQQIENGAPFDVFLSADAAHVQELQDRGLLAAGGRMVYAVGVLALWIPPASAANVMRLEDLARPEVRVIAVAKPELAPYGQAAVDALEHSGVWERVKSKIVYAENINMARQYGASGNADAVFTAKALVLSDGGRVMPVDESLHAPLIQELGIVAKSQHAAAARKFAAFLSQGTGREALAAAGYRIP
jgi:molybdate transport system substrate-binding protein